MGLLFSRRPAPVRPVRRARLSLEFLERREQPSDFFVPQPFTHDPNTPVYGPPEESYAGDEAPVIENFTVTPGSNGTWTLSGHVSDEQPGGLTVTFGGGIDGMDGVTVTTDANGYFSATVTAGSSGGVTATVVDAQGRTSHSVSRLVEVNE